MKYTDSHEWVKLEGPQFARVGVSTFAQKELGDIVYVELPTVGKTVSAGEEAAVLESTKAAADVYSPVSGKILEVNSELTSKPELVNQAAEGNGWLFTIELTDPAEVELLMDEAAYQAMLNGA